MVSGFFAMFYLLNSPLKASAQGWEQSGSSTNSYGSEESLENSHGSSRINVAPGFEGGVRLGYALAMGKSSDSAGDDLDEIISGQVPIWLDLGARITPSFFLGLYFSYGFGIVGDGIDQMCQEFGLDCSVNDIRFGVQMHYHLLPFEYIDPWLGVGIGYEWSISSQSMDGVDASPSITIRGPEWLNFQFGIDFLPADSFYLGPFFALSLGEFAHISMECSGAACTASGIDDESADVDDKAIHEWLFIGLRAGYTP
jgi:hypothetical protein